MSALHDVLKNEIERGNGYELETIQNELSQHISKLGNEQFFGDEGRNPADTSIRALMDRVTNDHLSAKLLPHLVRVRAESSNPETQRRLDQLIRRASDRLQQPDPYLLRIQAARRILDHSRASSQ